jgi:hypothetical protein
VLVDEVQDLTPVEIALLLEIARTIARHRGSALFVAAGDDSQTVHPSGFEWGLAKDLIHDRLGREPSDVVLGHPMRNPRAVLSLVQKAGSLYKTLSKELRPSGAAAPEASDIADEAQGARILVRPGTYRGPFLIDKALAIVGEGEPGSVVLESEMMTVSVEDCDVTIENLTIIRRKSAGLIASFGGILSLKKAARWVGKTFGLASPDRVESAVEAAGQSGGLGLAVTAIAGELRLRGCVIDGEGGGGIIAAEGAHLHAVGCKIHHAMVGIFAAPVSAVTIERSEVFECGNGITVGQGSRATVRESSVQRTEREGIYLHANAEVLLENNELQEPGNRAAHPVYGCRRRGQSDPRQRGRRRLRPGGLERSL